MAIVASNSVSLMNRVGNGWPSKRTRDGLTKCVPPSWIVTDGSPSVTCTGDIDKIPGGGHPKAQVGSVCKVCCFNASAQPSHCTPLVVKGGLNSA